MTKRDMASLLVKLVGIFLFCQLLPSLPMVLGIMAEFKDAQGVYETIAKVVAVGFIPLGLIGILYLVIRNSDDIAQQIIPEDSDASLLTGLNFKELQVLGFNAIGLWVIASALPKVVELAWMYYAQLKYFGEFKPDFMDNWMLGPKIVSLLVQVAMGIGLFLAPRGLQNLWYRIQPHRYQRIEDSDSGI